MTNVIIINSFFVGSAKGWTRSYDSYAVCDRTAILSARGRTIFMYIRIFETENGLQFGGSVYFYSSDRNLKYSCAISIRVFNEVGFFSYFIEFLMVLTITFPLGCLEQSVQ